jgi:hypothetical protein
MEKMHGNSGGLLCIVEMRHRRSMTGSIKFTVYVLLPGDLHVLLKSIGLLERTV